LLVGTNLASA